jgi:hypothetical protein
MARFLKGVLRFIALYVLVSVSLYFVLDTINRLRTGLENRWETQYGREILDREPPYSWRERVIVMLDIEPGIYWQEAAVMAALMTVPITLGLSLSALYRGRGRAGFLVLSGMILNGFVLGAVYKIPEVESLNMTFAGYLIANGSAVVISALIAGSIHGMLCLSIYRRKEESPALQENHGET